jgi:predicted tellurium resistance membrane protein TerC
VELLVDPHAWIAFVTLTALELVLGIDNIIFISILVDKLPPERRAFARRLGLFLAMFMRIALLLVLAWIIGLTAPLFTLFAQEISGRDLVLFLGGLFLIWKATGEIHGLMEGSGAEDERKEGAARVGPAARATFGAIISQIILIDLVFSLDSIITAVGMVNDVRIMVAAVVAAVALMMVAAGPIGEFVSRHPTVKMLALAFLIVIGVALVADAFEFHVPKGYIYFAMAFSVAVEMLNLRMRAKNVLTGQPKPHRPPEGAVAPEPEPARQSADEPPGPRGPAAGA